MTRDQARRQSEPRAAAVARIPRDLAARPCRLRTRVRGPLRASAALVLLVGVAACHEDQVLWSARAEPAPAIAEPPTSAPSPPACADVDTAVLRELSNSGSPVLRRYAGRIDEVTMALQDSWRAQGHASDESRARVELGCHRLVAAVLDDAETQRRVDELTALAHSGAGSGAQPSDDERDELIRLQHLAVASNARVESLLAEADGWSFDFIAVDAR